MAITTKTAVLAELRLARKEDRVANLTGADLTGADLTRADLTGANLTGADLTKADLTKADLTRAYLTGADLTRADLTRANLTGAYLTGANLTGAIFTGAYLTGAYLTEADLTWAYLTGAIFTGATFKDTLLFIDSDGTKYYLPKPPLQLQGLRWDIVATNEVIFIGCQRHILKEWESFSDDTISGMDKEALPFWREHKEMILSMAKGY